MAEQTRRQSAVETVTSTTLGFAGSWVIVFVTFSLIADRAIATTVTTLGCTVWSLLRGYCVRRWFATRTLGVALPNGDQQ